MNQNKIDIHFDFTSDSADYWKNFWQNNNGLGSPSSDPDSGSKTLQKYQKILYSRKLPNGEKMQLEECENGRLKWKEFYFSSDSITASFRYIRYKPMSEKVKKLVPNYEKMMEVFLHKSYTIGGEIIFPARKNSINQMRGCNQKISDRFDLTLECIRRFYKNEQSPLSATLEKDKNFFDLFVDFKGYVQFFFLDDLVSDDYEKVNLWLDNENFTKSALPQSEQEYLDFLQKELDFVAKRNKRIEKFTE